MARRRAHGTAFSLFAFQDIITSVMGIMVLVTLILALELVTAKTHSPAVQTVDHTESIQETIAQLEAEIQRLEKLIQQKANIVTDAPSLDAKTLEQRTERMQEDIQRLQQEVSDKNRELAQRRSQLEKTKNKDAVDGRGEQQELDELAKRIAQLKEEIQETKSEDRLFFSDGVKDKTTYIVEVSPGGLTAAQIGISAAPTAFRGIADFQRWLTTLDAQDSAIYFVVKPKGSLLFEQASDIVRKQRIDFGYTTAATRQKVIDPDSGAGPP